MIRLRWVRRTGLLLLLMALACGDRRAGLAGGGPAGDHAVEPEPAARATTNLDAAAALPAYGRVGPGGQPFEVTARTQGDVSYLYRPMGAEVFNIALRNAGLVHYPCSSCHTPGLGTPTVPPAAPATHKDIQPVHPAEAGPACTVCHAMPRVELLVLASGETATLDQPYRLCAQCHFAQVEAWAGGAHGKRLESWQHRRVIMNCTDCHDPHRPALGRRIPYPGPTLPRAGGTGR